MIEDKSWIDKHSICLLPHTTQSQVNKRTDEQAESKNASEQTHRTRERSGQRHKQADEHATNQETKEQSL